MGSLSNSLRWALSALLGLGAALLLLGAGAAHAESYHYDATGRLTQAAYSDGTTAGFVFEDRAWPSAARGLAQA